MSMKTRLIKVKFFLMAIWRLMLLLPNLRKAPRQYWREIIWQAFSWWNMQPWAVFDVYSDSLQITTTLNPSGKRTFYPTFIYRFGDAPKAYLFANDIDPNAPYQLEDGSIGIYHPDDGWMPELPIIRTLYPWLATWLYLYEIWQVTDTWYAPESMKG